MFKVCGIIIEFSNFSGTARVKCLQKSVQGPDKHSFVVLAMEFSKFCNLLRLLPEEDMFISRLHETQHQFKTSLISNFLEPHSYP